MKKFRGILLTLILIPNLSFASFSEGFNSLLNKFFNNEQSTEQTNFQSPQDLEINFPEPENLQGFRQEIQKEESVLEEIENNLYESQNKLSSIITEKNTAEFQLQFLDNDISISKQKLIELRKQKENWRKKLEEITREKSDTNAESRFLKNNLQNFLSKKFIQDETLGSGNDISVFHWLFSKKTVSKILEERIQKKQFEKIQKNKLGLLKNKQQKLIIDESSTAKIFHRIENLSQQEATQKSLLTELANAKAKIIARNEFTQGELKKQIINARKIQAESTIILQNLRLGMKEFKEYGDEIPRKNKETSLVFTFPLKVPKIITAKFLDPDYKETMGQDHWGVDFRAPQGTEIFAPADGVIKKVSQNGYQYSYLIIDHGNDLFTVYGHISDVFVSEGDIVKRGDKIALTGGTPGMAGSGFFTTGPHLHFEVFKNGKHVDPLDYLE